MDVILSNEYDTVWLNSNENVHYESGVKKYSHWRLSSDSWREKPKTGLNKHSSR